MRLVKVRQVWHHSCWYSPIALPSDFLTNIPDPSSRSPNCLPSSQSPSLISRPRPLTPDPSALPPLEASQAEGSPRRETGGGTPFFSPSLPPCFCLSQEIKTSEVYQSQNFTSLCHKYRSFFSDCMVCNNLKEYINSTISTPRINVFFC